MKMVNNPQKQHDDKLHLHKLLFMDVFLRYLLIYLILQLKILYNINNNNYFPIGFYGEFTIIILVLPFNFYSR